MVIIHIKTENNLCKPSKLSLAIPTAIQYNRAVKRNRKERDNEMTEKFTAYDLDDMIYGNATLIPSER